MVAINARIVLPRTPRVFFSFLVAIAHESRSSSIFFSSERANIEVKLEDGFLFTAEASSTRTYVNAADALSSFRIDPIIRPFDFLTYVLQGDLLLQVLCRFHQLIEQTPGVNKKLTPGKQPYKKATV